MQLARRVQGAHALRELPQRGAEPVDDGGDGGAGSEGGRAGGDAEKVIGKSAPWFILAVMLFANCVRALYIESTSMFVRGGVYRVGGGVSPPRVLYNPDPEYTEEARKAKYQGVVVLWLIVGQDGRTKDIRISRSLGMGLDQKAVEAVKLWKFEPAKKDGAPVAVQMNVEVNFRLY